MMQLSFWSQRESGKVHLQYAYECVNEDYECKHIHEHTSILTLCSVKCGVLVLLAAPSQYNLSVMHEHVPCIRCSRACVCEREHVSVCVTLYRSFISLHVTQPLPLNCPAHLVL